METQNTMISETDERMAGALELAGTLERLAGAAALLEQAVERIAEKQTLLTADAEAYLGRVVATVEGKREVELEQKLAAAEAEIAELRALQASSSSRTAHTGSGRKTVPAAMVNLLAKQGVTLDSVEAGALDAALTSLSIEQRIAVKAQLMRAGLIG